MNNPVVLAKRDAAAAWIATVNASQDVHDRWAYLLASGSVVANAATWAALKNGGQAYR